MSLPLPTETDLLWVNIGSSGLVLPGWENIDRAPIPGAMLCDVRLGLPFRSRSARVVVASHVLEHLHPHTELPKALREIHRILTPGGTVRIAVPDLEVLLRCYMDGDWAPVADSQKELDRYVGVGFDQMPAALRLSAVAFGNASPNSAAYDGHHAVWDEAAMRWILERAGFIEIQRAAVGVSRDPELPKRYTDNWVAQSLIVEAAKA